MAGDDAALNSEVTSGRGDERNVSEFGAVKLDVLSGEEISVSIELDAPGKSGNGGVRILMTVNVREDYVVGRCAEGGEDPKLDVMISKLGTIGLERGVLDACAKAFDQGFAISNPFEME